MLCYNGKASEFYKCRDIRQGRCLSTLLFLVVVEVLAYTLDLIKTKKISFKQS